MLEFELWTALYLVLGVGTFLYYKSFIQENTTDSLALGIAAAMVIAIWWLMLISDFVGFVWYSYKRFRNRKKLCGAQFPKTAMNIDLWCGLAKHDDDTLHEGVADKAYARWSVDDDGAVFIDKVSTY